MSQKRGDMAKSGGKKVAAATEAPPEDKTLKDLKKVYPGETYTLSTGEKILIKPVPIGRLRFFTEAVLSLIDRLRGLDADLNDPSTWPDLFDMALDEILAVMALVLEKDREWVDELLPADAMHIATVIVKQNLTPETKKKAEGLLAAVKPLFPTSSNSSSDRGTPGRK